MRIIKLLVVALAGIIVIAVLTGCRTEENKKYKMREFLYRYGNVTAEEMYQNASSRVAGVSANGFNYKIESVSVKSTKTKEINGNTYHFVKCKMIYKLTLKSDEKSNSRYARYMALAIKEDGFGEMRVDLSESKEVIVASFDEDWLKDANKAYIAAGEELIK